MTTILTLAMLASIQIAGPGCRAAAPDAPVLAADGAAPGHDSLSRTCKGIHEDAEVFQVDVVLAVEVERFEAFLHGGRRRRVR